MDVRIKDEKTIEAINTLKQVYSKTTNIKLISHIVDLEMRKHSL